MRRHSSPALLGFLAFALVACQDSTGPGGTAGTVVVSVATTGADRDPDGYALTLDGTGSRAVEPDGRSVLTGVSPGRHLLALGGLAANCAVDGQNPRDITVTTSDTTEVALTVACTAVTGALRITTVTNGFLPDPDGYQVVVDQRPPQEIVASGSLFVTGLAPGSHLVRLTDVAEDCTLTGNNPANATLEAGHTAEVTFQLECGALPAGDLLFNGSVDDATHVFHRRPDGSIVDLTPDADGYGGRWSPDGTRIAFVSARSGTTGIYLMDVDGRHVTQLTNNGEVAPDWSPDGTRLLFWPEVTRGFGPVSLMNADGSDVHSLGQGSLPVWSPDGARIAFERQNGICVFDLCGLAVFVMNADGSDAHQIKGTVTAFDYAAVPEWSPDGSRIVYLLGDYSRLPHARIMTTEGLDVIDLGVVASQAIWSPDGTAIAFTAPSPGDTAPIMVVPATGGTPVELVTRPGVSVPTDWR
jgi:hypothetical protein